MMRRKTGKMRRRGKEKPKAYLPKLSTLCLFQELALGFVSKMSVCLLILRICIPFHGCVGHVLCIPCSSIQLFHYNDEFISSRIASAYYGFAAD